MTQHAPSKKQSLLKQLGPGLVSGAADDDPSGIATYSQAGAQFGFSMLWTSVLTYPFMAAIQLISAKIGRVTGIGIVANVKNYYPKSFVLILVVLLVLANTINIAADVAAMGSALQLVLGGPAHGHLYGLLFGLFCIVMQVFIPYRRYSPILKAMTMVLFVYVIAAFTIHIPWREVLINTVFPDITWSQDYILTIVAVFGTTISPYLFFWQASQEIEEMNLSHHHIKALKDLKTGGNEHMKRIRFDTMVGMAFSNIISFFIILTAALTLHANGITDIQSSSQAAEALRPLAGDLTFYLFAAGIIGTGLLAVPVLAGSAAYGIAEVYNWHATLEAKPKEAKLFYAIIAATTLAGVVINFLPVDPVKMLFWAAVINGFVAVPIMVMMMLVASNTKIMGRFKLSPRLKIAGWCATAIMAMAAGTLIWSWVT